MTPLWKQRNFVLVWSGQLASWIGTQVSGIALPLVVLSITGSPAQAGIVGAIRGLVFVFLAIPAGALIDRWDRKTIMEIGNLGSGIVMASIALLIFLKILTIPVLYIITAIEGAFFVFASLARFTSTPLLVKKEQLAEASAQMSVADFISLSVGPALGGILYQTFGAVISFAVDAFSYLINMFSVFFITADLQLPQQERTTKLHEEMHAGFLWFWREKSIRFLTFLYGAITIVAIGLYLLIIVIAKNYHAASSSIGIILGVGSVGGIIGAIHSPHIYKRFRFRNILIWSMIGFTIAFGLYFFTYNLLLLALVTFFINLIAPVFDVTIYTYTASIIPDEIRGRVNSFLRLTAWGAVSLGYFLMGVSIQFLGITRTIGAFFGFLFLLSILVVYNHDIKKIQTVR